MAKYRYDTWGKLLSTTGSMANSIGKLNPFLYRGYYSDFETGLYYLNSRYYDAQTGRFINADGQLNPDTGMTGNNLFSYCNNNSVNMSDSSGTRFTEFDDGTGRWYYVNSDGKVFQGTGSKHSSANSSVVPSSAVIHGAAIGAGVDISKNILENTRHTYQAYKDSKNIIHLTPSCGETFPRFPGLAKGLGKASWVVTGISLGMDIGNTWTAKNSNTAFQRGAKTGIQIGGAAVGVASGSGAAALIGITVAGGPIGWGILGTAIIVGSPFAIDAGEEYAYDKLGIK